MTGNREIWRSGDLDPMNRRPDSPKEIFHGIGKEGLAKPVNQSTLIKGDENWQDIKVQFAAFAVAKA